MKKINVTFWIILAGAILYIGSLWQRPLFSAEYYEFKEAIHCLLKESTPHYSGWLNLAPLKIFGVNSFSFRIVPAILTLTAGLFIFLAGRKSSFSNAGAAGALIFLLSPAVFFAGTVSIHPMYAAAPALIGAFSCFMIAGSGNIRSAVPAMFTAAVSLAILIVEGSIFFWGMILLVHLVFLLIRKFVIKSSFSPVYMALSLLPFLLTALWGFRHAGICEVKFPEYQNIKTAAAIVGAGLFPWILFLLPAARNFRSRVQNICNDTFGCFALLLTCAGIICGSLTPVSSGILPVAFAGFAILLAAGIDMEWLENGFRSSNIVIYTVCGICILLAAATGIWAGLGAWTKFIHPAWKIFSSKEIWAMNVIVPVVTAIWCFTAAGEKISRNRKFLAFCAGIAFLLFASHGIVPQKIVAGNAPEFFIRQVIIPRVSKSTVIRGDSQCRLPLQTLFRQRAIWDFAPDRSMKYLKNDIQQGKKVCIMLSSPQAAAKLPFPKTTIRSGRFCAVFYNIDFPEMRVRKP